MIEFIKELNMNGNLMYVGVILIWVWAMLLLNRLVLRPKRRRKQILKKNDERMRQAAIRRLNDIQVAEGDRTDVWSRTSHDTISRELDPVMRKRLERAGMAD